MQSLALRSGFFGEGEGSSQQVTRMDQDINARDGTTGVEAGWCGYRGEENAGFFFKTSKKQKLCPKMEN